MSRLHLRDVLEDKLAVASLRLGGDIYLQDRNGNLPLHLAFIYNLPAAIASLLFADKAGNNTISGIYLPFYGQESLTDWKARNGMTRERYHYDAPRSPVPDISICLVARNQDGNTPLHLACRNCDISAMSIMVEQGSDLSLTNHAGLTPLEMLPSDDSLASSAFKLLQMTFAKEALDAVRYLVYSRGLALDSKDENGETVLHWAIKENRVSVVSLIRGLGGDVNAKDNEGNTPLHIAASIRFSPLSLLFGGQVNIEAQNKEGNTPLHYACTQGWLEGVSYLLEQGASILAKNKLGNRPLHLAARSIHSAVIGLLLDSGAPIDLRNNNGDTALHLACRAEGNASHQLTDIDRLFASVVLLLDRGALIDCTNNKLMTPLHVACLDGDVALVTLLLDRGADLSLLANEGYSCLHLAATNCREVIRMLIERGVDVNACTRSKNTALHLLLQNLRQDIDTSIDPTTQPISYLYRPMEELERASIQSKRATIESYVSLLIRKGASPSVRNNILQTPLSMALSKQAFSLVHLFLDESDCLQIDRAFLTQTNIPRDLRMKMHYYIHRRHWLRFQYGVRDGKFNSGDAQSRVIACSDLCRFVGEYL